jgi:hypothetical protein
MVAAILLCIIAAVITAEGGGGGGHGGRGSSGGNCFCFCCIGSSNSNSDGDCPTPHKEIIKCAHCRKVLSEKRFDKSFTSSLAFGFVGLIMLVIGIIVYVSSVKNQN